MATIAADTIRSTSTRPAFDFARLARLGLVAVLPLAAFGGANYVGEATGFTPLFFSPAGMQGWMGAVAHLAVLAPLGLALGLTMESQRSDNHAEFWLVAFILGLIAFPFFAPLFDAFALALAMTSLMLIGMAAGLRVARRSGVAGWLMAPALAWVGFGSALGLAMTAAFSPPFALVNAQQPALAAS